MGMQVHTRVLSSGSTMVISSADGVKMISIKTDYTGSCTITGGMEFQDVESQAITCSGGDAFVLQTPSPALPLDDLTITATADNVYITIYY